MGCAYVLCSAVAGWLGGDMAWEAWRGIAAVEGHVRAQTRISQPQSSLSVRTALGLRHASTYLREQRPTANRTIKET